MGAMSLLLGIGDRWVLECEREGVGFCAEKVAVNGLPAIEVHIIPLSLRSLASNFSFKPSNNQLSRSVTLFPLQSHPTMAFVDMDSVHFYQPPSMAGRLGERRFAALNLDVRAISNESYKPIALEPSSNSSGRLEDYNSIESFDSTVSLPRESLDLFRESTVDPCGPQSHAIGTTCSYYL